MPAFPPFPLFLRAVTAFLHHPRVRREFLGAHHKHRSEEQVEQQWGEVAPLSEALAYVEPPREESTVNSHARPHAIVDFADDRQHLGRDAEAQGVNGDFPPLLWMASSSVCDAGASTTTGDLLMHRSFSTPKNAGLRNGDTSGAT